MTGTFFFSSHDKRLRRGNDAAKGNITLRKLAKGVARPFKDEGTLYETSGGVQETAMNNRLHDPPPFLRTKGARHPD
jgi:hypothetical protein